MSIKGAMNYSFTAAIISTLKSYMLNSEDYEALLKSTSVKDFYNILEKTSYRIFLSKTYEEKEAENLERRLYEDYINTLNKIYRVCPQISLKMVDAIRLKHELHSLKMILRSLISELDTKYALQLVIPIGKYSPDVCKSILESKSIQIAIENVEEPDLRRALIDIFKQQRESIVSYLLEATIDRYSLTKIWRSLLPEPDRVARRIVGTMTDFSNIMFALRSKYLDLEADIVHSFIIPVYRYFPPSQLDKVIGAPTTRDAMRLLNQGYYGKLITQPSLGLETTALSEIETIFDRYLAQECLYSFQGYRFHAGLIISYLTLKFNEISDISAILFGKVNKVPVDTIRRKLILHQHIS